MSSLRQSQSETKKGRAVRISLEQPLLSIWIKISGQSADTYTQLFEFIRPQSAFCGQLQIRQRVNLQVPVGLRRVRVDGDRVSGCKQRFLKQHILQIASRWPVP